MKLLAMFLIVAVVHSDLVDYGDYSASDEDKETDYADYTPYEGPVDYGDYSDFDEDKETDYADYTPYEGPVDYGDYGDYDDVDMDSCPSGYTEKPSTNYEGNDIKCGYKWPNKIRDDCTDDATCIGFSVWNNKPQCTKSGGDGSTDYAYMMCIKQGLRRAVTSTEDELPAPHVTQRANIRGH